MDVWITETLSMLSLDTTKIHGSEVSMRCCTSSGLCFSRWAWVEYWKAFGSSGCVLYGYEMLWSSINPSCFAGCLRGFVGCRFITSTSLYHVSIGTLGGSIPHPPKKASLRAASSFHGVSRLVGSTWESSKVRTCLEGRSTFIEPVQRKRLGGKKHPNQTRWYESDVY